MRNIKIFGLNGSNKFAKQICSYLDMPISEHIERNFEDGESYLRSDTNVRGSDVYVVHSLYSDEQQKVSEKFTNLLFFIGSLRDASAKRITVVCPYLGYARQDRKTESRAPITTKYIAKLIEAAGADRLLTMDVHNLAGFQNAFRIPVDNLEAKNLFAEALCGLNEQMSSIGSLESVKYELAILSPDSGGMERVRKFRNVLERMLKLENQIEVVYLDKQRISGKEVRGDKIIGNIDGKKIIIIDDMIASGRTIKLSCDAVNRQNGEIWAVCATHGLFISPAEEYLSSIPRILVTDSIPPFRLTTASIWDKRLYVIQTARVFGQAIRRTHEGGSISDLLK